jgi:hypothetical protein
MHINMALKLKIAITDGHDCTMAVTNKSNALILTRFAELA